MAKSKEHKPFDQSFAMPYFPTPVVYVQYKGVWDMNGLYNLIADFMRQNKFTMYEKQQRHRRPGPFGFERQYKWEGESDIDEYHRWHLFITIETFDENDFDMVMKDGTTKKMTKGRIWIQIRGRATADYEKKWEGSIFSLHLKKFYNKYVINKRYQLIFWDRMYYGVVVKMHEKITNYLKTYSSGNEHRYGAGVH